MKKPECRSFCGKRYGWISFFSNLFNAVFKIGVGMVAGSHALVADGFHSLSDAMTAIITIVTLQFSQRPSDKSHPYGHGKVEYISASLFSLVLLTLATIIMVKSIRSIVVGNLSAPSFIAIGPAIVSIMVNMTISDYGLCVGREIKSPVITANAKENRADAYSSIASLVGIVGAISGYPILDPTAAIVVSLLIGRMGWEIMREAGSGLMDGSIEKERRAQMRRLVGTIPDVQKVIFLRTRSIGQKTWADLGIEVSPSLNLDEGDRIAQEVQNSLMRNYPEMQEAVVYLNSGSAPPWDPEFLLRFLWPFRRRGARE